MFFPVHRCVVMELCLPRLCPVTSTPPRSTTPVPRASRSATQSALPPPITPAWPPVASAVWECSPSTGLDRPLRLCLPGEWQRWTCNLRVKCKISIYFAHATCCICFEASNSKWEMMKCMQNGCNTHCELNTPMHTLLFHLIRIDK